jgi:hypothetical protein
MVRSGSNSATIASIESAANPSVSASSPRTPKRLTTKATTSGQMT